MQIDQDLFEIFGELDRDRLMNRVVRYVNERANAGGVSIFLRDDITGNYVLRATTGLVEGADRMPDARLEYATGEGLTGWVAKHGRPLRIANVMDQEELAGIASDLAWTKKFSEIHSEQGRAFLGVPILSRDGSGVRGVLRISARDPNQTFDSSDESLVDNIAQTVSVAIENSYRYERERRRARYFQLLVDVSKEINPRRPKDEMRNVVVGKVQEGFRVEAAALFLRDQQDISRFVLRAAAGLSEQLIEQVACEVGEGIVGRIAASGQSVQMRTHEEVLARSDSALLAMGAHLPSGHVRSLLAAPLRLGDETYGVLVLLNKIPSRPGHRDWFTENDREYLEILATEVAAAVEGARYLRALSDVGVAALRMQRLAAFGTLAQRVPHEISNPLATARLALSNLRSEVEGDDFAAHWAEARPRFVRRLETAQSGLDDVRKKLLELVNFSQRIGFTRLSTRWNEVVRDALIWLAAQRRQHGVEVHTRYGDLPLVFVEPNELFGVVVSLLRIAMDTLGEGGGVITIHTQAVAAGTQVQTTMSYVRPGVGEGLRAIVEGQREAWQEPTPLQLEWALAQETIEREYGGTLSWKVDGDCAELVLKFPVEARV